MMTRGVAALLCLLYLSAGTVFSALHHHDASLQGDQQCAACAWHHENSVDLPQAHPLLTPPHFITFAEEAPVIVIRELSPFIHPNRGPPGILV